MSAFGISLFQTYLQATSPSKSLVCVSKHLYCSTIALAQLCFGQSSALCDTILVIKWSLVVLARV